MLLCNILIKKRRFILFPESRMLFLKPFQYCFHNSLPEEFRFVPDSVPVTIDAQSSCLTVVEHKGKTICPS